VLELIAQGKTNKEAGRILGISDRTVQIHVAHVYEKIGAYNRAGATSWLIENRAETHGRFGIARQGIASRGLREK
jgi:DNA-binding NarL/FixJ family response regulator